MTNLPSITKSMRSFFKRNRGRLVVALLLCTIFIGPVAALSQVGSGEHPASHSAVIGTKLAAAFFGVETAEAMTGIPPYDIYLIIKKLLGGASLSQALGGNAITELLVPALIKALEGIALLILTVASYFLQSMAIIMDVAIEVTISSGTFAQLDVVNIGWTAVRDISNMFFIFALLYIAIQTILGIAGSQAKRWLAHLIIAAIMINFSLFATKVVIDAGNVLATAFWSKISVKAGPAQVNSASSKLLSGFDLQTILTNEEKSTGKKLELKPIQLTMVYAGGAIFTFIAAYVFLAIALMMVSRTVQLVILMIFSPFAFMSFGLPKLEQYGHQWLDKLIKQTFAAPFLIFMLYLNAVLIDKTDLLALSGSKDATFMGALSGVDPKSYAIIFNFIILIGFLIASLKIADGFAGQAGATARGLAAKATRWAGGMTAGVAVGGSAYAMRQTFGKFGQMGTENQELQKKAAEKGWGGAWARGRLALYSGMATASYDARATKAGQSAFGAAGLKAGSKAGGEGGFDAKGSILSHLTLGSLGYTGSEHDKKVLEIAEKRFKGNPKAKEKYLRANLGSTSARDADGNLIGDTLAEKAKSMLGGKKRYDVDSDFKDTRAKVAAEQRVAAAKENIKKLPAEMEANKKLIAQLEALQASGTALSAAQTEQLRRATGELDIAQKNLRASVESLNGKEFGEFVNETTFDKDHPENRELFQYMTRQQLAYLNSNSTAYPPQVLQDVGAGIMEQGNEESRQYLIRQAQLKSSMFPVDLRAELKREADTYKREMGTFDPTTADAAARQKHADELQRIDGRAQDLLGALTPKEVARLDKDLKTNEVLVRNFTAKHFNEIENYHKNILQDTGTQAGQEIVAAIRKAALEAGTQPTREYMNKAMRRQDSIYYDPNAPKQKKGGGGRGSTDDEEDDEDKDE